MERKGGERNGMRRKKETKSGIEEGERMKEKREKGKERKRIGRDRGADSVFTHCEVIR